MLLIERESYRSDIDGLRAIAVISVILFHLGILPNGYLGVDIFFVISGYLITGVIYNGVVNHQFSIFKFYERRIRRILPLTLFIVSVSLVIGLIVMLPDDLENLSQSVIATNFFANNILQSITTRDYWDIANEYKPLMHTWSLGVEEQYYLLYPILLVLIGHDNHERFIRPALILLTIVSLVLFVMPFQSHEKFYYIQFRFFELSAGGLLALLMMKKVVVSDYTSLFVLLLLSVLLFDPDFIPDDMLIIVTVILTVGVIACSNSDSVIASFVLKNKVSVFLGLISFSLYMWHQVVFSFARYFIVSSVQPSHYAMLLITVLVLSIGTYYLIEKPYRNSTLISRKVLMAHLGGIFVVSTSVSFYLYTQSGVINDVPELGIIKSENSLSGLHSRYNHRVFNYNKPFHENGKLKVLVVGNSLGRDWANVILESGLHESVNLSYFSNPTSKGDFYDRFEDADLVFFVSPFDIYIDQLDLPLEKIYVVGTKSFGENMGYFYNNTGDDYYEQRVQVDQSVLIKNAISTKKWGDKYIDLIGMVIDHDNTVPVFTPEKMFISQDGEHFTKSGAEYFSLLLNDTLLTLLSDVDSRYFSSPSNK